MSTETLTEVTISVTQEHIDNGVAGECALCPVALAIRAAMPGVNRAKVFLMAADTHGNPGALIFRSDGTVASMPLPEEVARFVADFDDGEPVSPFTFTAEVAA